MVLIRVLAVAFVAAGLQLSAGAGDRLPKLRATTLSGREISIPGDSRVAAYILSFGFSHKSSAAVAAWDRRIAAAFLSEPRVAYYELPVLQGLPGLVKPFVLHGMRRAIPEAEHSRFAPLYQEEAALKRIVEFRDPEAAYLMVVTSDGNVVWTSHAPASDTGIAELRKAVSQLVQ